MDNLQELDFQFTQQLQYLKPLIKEHTFEKQFEFVLEPGLDFKKIDLLKFPGIYLFEIRVDQQKPLADWLTGFEEEWGSEQYRYKFVPNVKRKRVKAHTEQKDWISLYIGKSRCISKRVKEHLILKLDQPTTALKLMERENMYGQVFRVSTIKVEVKNYDLIMPLFESAFRSTLNPIVGRQ